MKKIDRIEISRKIQGNEPINISFKYIDEELLLILNSILAKILAKADQLFLLNSLITILREAAVNALKANAKRVYFQKKSLDITDPAHYKKGMALFKKEVIGEFRIIQKDLQSSDYRIEMGFRIKNDSLLISIRNNTSILPEEQDRIRVRMQKAIKYNDFSDAYAEIQDDSEGAGLGIVLSILFLKNMGIDPGKFSIRSEKDITMTTLVIPSELRPSGITTKVQAHILSEIDGIPTFPQHILELQRLCNNPESSISEISERIMVDPALVTDVIKLSNSAAFFPGKRIEGISEAIMTIGMKNVNAILTVSLARRILNERYASYEQIWEHCHRTAFYARKISSILHLEGVSDRAFMAGLLHDLGKIILLATDLSLVEKIAKIVNNRKIITSTVMEEISIGISHSAIGALIAEKWNFPEYLVEAIKNHHSPLSSGKNNDVVCVVYLANMFCGIEDRRYSFYYVEQDVLERYGIADKREFDALHKKIKTRYDSIQDRIEKSR